ncbi:hypothetical protein [Paenibacillus sp. FSL K6-1558]|uniref:hypothetical protein n=1 Tax=Paenibacillus sp. FSL K6-1558 TaxID=2921473 RepID=UPI0030F71D39
MAFLFFYFEEFKPGMVCRVVGSPDNKMVVVHKVFEDMLWCYDNRPVEYKLNSKKQRVIAFDPACVMSPYPASCLEITPLIPMQEDGWGASYRHKRMWL